MPESQVTGIEIIPDDPLTANDAATGEPPNIAADATAGSIAQGPQTNEILAPMPSPAAGSHK